MSGRNIDGDIISSSESAFGVGDSFYAAVCQLYRDNEYGKYVEPNGFDFRNGNLFVFINGNVFVYDGNIRNRKPSGWYRILYRSKMEVEKCVI